MDISLPRLLIVEDEPNVLYPIKSGLERFKFLVDAFTNPLEALDAFTAGYYDLAILDISMPEMSGLVLTRELLKKDPRLIVCFLTGFEEYRGEFQMEFPKLNVECFFEETNVGRRSREDGPQIPRKIGLYGIGRRPLSMSLFE